MRRSWYRSAASAIVMGALVALAGCGSVTDDDLLAPDESTIEFTISDFTLTLAPGTCVLGSVIPKVFTAIVKNGDAIPLNDIQVTFRLTIPGFVFLDGAGNVIGVDPVLGISRLVRATDDNGTVSIIVGIPECVDTADDLEAITGTASTSIRLDVVEGS